METIHLDDFLTDGILRESDFREKISIIDWSGYSDKTVLIRGCASVPVPTWAHLIITAELSQFAKEICYGDPNSFIKVYTKK